VYEAMFAGSEGKAEMFRNDGSRAALRFSYPEGRTDSAGRVIPHDFVVLGPRRLVARIVSVDRGRQEIWPAVAERFAAVWKAPHPPEWP